MASQSHSYSQDRKQISTTNTLTCVPMPGLCTGIKIRRKCYNFMSIYMMVLWLNADNNIPLEYQLPSLIEGSCKCILV